MPDVTINFGITYTPPAAAQNSGQAVLNTTASYQAQSVGTMDIPTTITPATVIPVPFNSIDVGAQVCVVRNSTLNPIGIRINGSVTNNFQLEAGGTWSYVAAAIPTVAPLTEVDIEIITAPVSATQYVNYWVFGS